MWKKYGKIVLAAAVFVVVENLDTNPVKIQRI